MLIKAKTLEGFKLDSLDGEIGKVKEFYFDDRHWTIRYLVAETGTWLADRQVLISPYALSSVDKEAKNIAVDLTKKQIEDSPPLDSHKPVSHQYDRHSTVIMATRRIGRPVRVGYYPYPMRDREQWKVPAQDKKDGIPFAGALTV